MKINIPKVIRPLDLGERAPEYKDVIIQVWVNPPRGKMLEYYALVQAYAKGLEQKISAEGMAGIDKKIQVWYSEIWSQAPDQNTHWSATDVSKLIKDCQENDPGLWKFLAQRTHELIGEYRAFRKKV